MLIFIAAPWLVFAENATLYLKPASGIISAGGTIDLGLYLNTGGNNVNAVKAEIKFPPDKLQVTYPAIYDDSIVSLWVTPPTFSNSEGVIIFQGGMPSPGINTDEGIIGMVRLRAINVGQAAVSIKDSSAVFLADGRGTDILGGKSGAIFSIKLPPPAGPKVIAVNQPDPNRWYQENSTEFVWEMPNGATAVSYVLDNEPLTLPDNISESAKTSVLYRDLSSGTHYFHIRVLNSEGVWGSASHLVVSIDTEPPADFPIQVSPAPKTATRKPVISFSTSDRHSGISRYVLRIIRTSQENAVEASGAQPFFIEVNSPFVLPELDFGKYNLVMRTYDLAGNYREVQQKLVISQAFFRDFGPEGINFRANLILPWWALYLILGGAVFLALYCAHFAYKQHREVERKLKVGILNLVEHRVSQRLRLLQKKRDEFEER